MNELTQPTLKFALGSIFAGLTKFVGNVRIDDTLCLGLCLLARDTPRPIFTFSQLLLVLQIKLAVLVKIINGLHSEYFIAD